ncbi:MAG: META domain-containing protein [Candidatus Electrothrix sp. AR5]|nr:META domain-containing protein [Candidatus Electrothrix sp. AR5]
MKSSRKILALSLFVGLMLAGCASGPWEILHEEDWVLQTLNGQEVPEDSPEITLNFGADGRLAGTAGCNNYSGPYTYTAAKNKIKIGSISRTFKICNPSEIMQQERQYLEKLVSALKYRIEDDQLELQSENGISLLVFEQD